MKRTTLRSLLAFGLLVLASLAMAIYPSLSNTLSGVPLNGSTSSGEIKVNQSKLPTSPAQVQIKMQNVSLPNGTALRVNIDGEFYGTVTVNNRQVSATLSTFLMTGRGARVAITTQDGTLVATVLQAWKT